MTAEQSTDLRALRNRQQPTQAPIPRPVFAPGAGLDVESDVIRKMNRHKKSFHNMENTVDAKKHRRYYPDMQQALTLIDSHLQRATIDRQQLST